MIQPFISSSLNISTVDVIKKHLLHVNSSEVNCIIHSCSFKGFFIPMYLIIHTHYVFIYVLLCYKTLHTHYRNNGLITPKVITSVRHTIRILCRAGCITGVQNINLFYEF